MRSFALAAAVAPLALLSAAAGSPEAALPFLAGAPLFTRLHRRDLLGEGVRPRIVNLLREEPGLGITDVCARLGIGWGTAVHHLTRLESAGLVVSQDAGRRRRFFLPSESSVRRTAVCVLSSDINRRLIEAIHAKPGITQSQLCEALGISAPLAHKYLARLIRDGLVTARREWRLVRYAAGPDAAAALEDFSRLQGARGTEGPTADAADRSAGVPVSPRSTAPSSPAVADAEV